MFLLAGILYSSAALHCVVCFRAFLVACSTIVRHGCLSCVQTLREDWQDSWGMQWDLARRGIAKYTGLFTTTASVLSLSFPLSTCREMDSLSQQHTPYRCFILPYNETVVCY